VRLDPGTTKNREGRVFKMTRELRTVLEAQRDERDRLNKQDKLCPSVFFRMVAEKRGGEKKPRPIMSLNKAWAAACVAAGCPGRIPHDLRRTAVRNMVRAGVPERISMKLTGHKTRPVFERYNIVSDGDLAVAAERLDAHFTHAGGVMPSAKRNN
jgi:integrase